ncbi:MAG: two-component regulator propeller domain-containing protein, partial [Actinomycetota bacterium]
MRDHGLLSNTVRAIDTARDGSVWVGTPDGLNRVSHLDGVESREVYRLPNTRVTALHIDRAGTLWVGTETGVGAFADGRFTPVPIAGVSSLGIVFAMTSDREGALWLCHVGAASPSRVLRGVITDLDAVPEIQGRSCTSAYTDRSGRVWIGFTDGSLVAHTGGGYHLYSPQDGLPGGSIYSMWEGENGTLWVGTSRGFSRLRDGRITSVTERNGIPDTDVTALVGDQDGHVWCAFNGGIIRLSESEVDRVAADASYRVRYTFLDSSDGLLSPPTRYGFPTAALGGDGRLWFQTVSGLAVVEPRALRKTMPARVTVERVVADGQTLSASTPDVVLPPRTTRLEIHYAALSLAGASKVRFS